MAEQIHMLNEPAIDEAIEAGQLVGAAAAAGCVATAAGFAIGAEYYAYRQDLSPTTIARGVSVATEHRMQDFFVEMSSYSLKAGAVCLGFWGIARLAESVRARR